MFWNKKESEEALPDMPTKLPPNFSKPVQPLEEEPQSLPSFPDSPNNKGFSQSAIKEAVSGNARPLSLNSKPIEQLEEHNDEDMRPSLASTVKAQAPADNKLYSQTISLQPSKIKEIDESQSLPTIQSQTFEQEPPQIQAMRTKPIVKETYIPPARAPVRFTESQPKNLSTPVSQNNNSSAPNVFVKIDKFYAAKKALEETKRQLNDIENILKKIRETKMREEQELENWEKEMLSAKNLIQEVNSNMFERLE